MQDDIENVETNYNHICPLGKKIVYQTINNQKGIIRFNCADSLDRTNIATFCKIFIIIIFLFI